MTDITTAPDTATAPDTDRAAWHRILQRVGLVYLFSRLCVLVGAAIVAAELRADENIRIWHSHGDVVGGLICQKLHHLVIDTCLHENASGRGAILSSSEKSCDRNSFSRCL